MRHATVRLRLAALPALADPPNIEKIEARPTSSTWQVDVTLCHGGTG